MVAAAVFCAAVLVPLFVQLKAVPIASEYLVFGYQNPTLDAFSWWKGRLMIGCGLAVALSLVLIGARLTVTAGLCIALGGLIAASALLSSYRYLGLQGVPYIFEGLWVSLAYVALALGAAQASQAAFGRWVLPAGISLSAMWIAAVGVAEACGAPFFGWDWWTHLALTTSNGWAAAYAGDFKAAALPFGHPNYAGMYAAMIGPYLATVAATRQNLREAVLPGVAAVSAYGLLVASLSRGSWVAGAVASVVAVGCLRRGGVPRTQVLVWIGAATAVGLFGFMAVNPGMIAARMRSFTGALDPQEAAFAPPLTGVLPPLQRPQATTLIAVEGGRLRLDSAGLGLLVERQLHGVKLMDLEFRPLPVARDGDSLTILDPRFHGFSLGLREGSGFLVLSVNNTDVAVTNAGFRVARAGGFVAPVQGERFPLPFNDLAFNRRGFIWARSIPLLKQSYWLGQGPGAFPFAFPNNDPVAMSAVFGPRAVVDKPHNFYLGFAFMHGLPALVLLLTLMLGCCWKTWRQLRSPIRTQAIESLPYVMGVIGYGLAGLTADGSIGTTAPFWALLGTAIGLVTTDTKRTGGKLLL